MGESRSQRPWRARFAATALGLAAGLALAESALRCEALPVSGALGQYLHSCYEGKNPSHSVFAYSPQLDLNVYRPGFSTRCRWFTAQWHHRSDAYGFRNPETWSTADVVLLGDSMIYGQGVEEEQTVARRLQHELGVRVANLGVTGACPVHYLAYLRSFALPLEPRAIVVFLFANDLEDIGGYRDAGRRRAFATTGHAPEARLFSREELVGSLVLPELPSWWRRLHVYRALEYLTVERRPVPPQADPPPTGAQVPTTPEGAARFAARHAAALAYLKTALAEMAAAASAYGADLILAYIPGRSWQADGQGPMQQRDLYLPGILRRSAAEHRGRYFDATAVLVDDRGVPRADVALPQDGHLSAKGHGLIARALAAFLKRHDVLGAGRASDRAGRLAIDAGAVAAGIFLQDGWSGPETAGARRVRWSEGPRSIVTVQLRPSAGDQLLELDAIPLPGPTPQAIRISINGRSQQTVRMTPQWNHYQVRVAAGVVRRGINTIVFSYARTGRPRDVIPGSADARELAVMFDTIGLRPAPPP